jgi:hypothetical protein
MKSPREVSAGRSSACQNIAQNPAVAVVVDRYDAPATTGPDTRFAETMVVAVAAETA